MRCNTKFTCSQQFYGAISEKQRGFSGCAMKELMEYPHYCSLRMKVCSAEIQSSICANTAAFWSAGPPMGKTLQSGYGYTGCCRHLWASLPSAKRMSGYKISRSFYTYNFRGEGVLEYL